MNILYALAAVIALGLAVYLTIALLKPEWFE
jgi:K+-transporting ATPase KdpF subunit